MDPGNGDKGSGNGRWRIRLSLWFVLITAALLLSFIILANETAAEVHDPIYITSNEGFGTPNNGVSNWDDSSAGTEDNPYIIEDWEILASTAIVGQGGIHIENTDVHFIIRNCELHNGTPVEKFGIYFSEVENGRIENTTCRDNKYGVRIHASSNILICSCDVYDNYGYASGHGIYFDSSADNRITSCEVHNNSGFGAGYPNGYGILVESSSNTTIDTCLIHNNTRDGIRSISDSPEITIHSCDLYGNYHGIDLEDSAHSTIWNCTSYANAYLGILLYTDSDECHVTDCMTYDNGWHGIFFKWCSNNRLDNSSSYRNDGDGIILDSSDNEIVDCSCRDNSGIGVYIVGSSGNRLEYCTSDDNDFGGIVLHTSNGNEITHCNVHGNSYYGLSLYWDDFNNIVTFNRAFENEDGIHIGSNSENNQIYLNDFIDNDQNVQSEGAINVWNSPEQMNYEYNGETYTNYMGNYWSDYSGTDYDDDGIGDTPYTSTIIDAFPLMEEWEHYFNRLPSVGITWPGEGEEISGLINVEGNATDPDGDEQIQRVEIRIDDGDWEEANGTTNWSHEWDTTDVENGGHTIHARAYDGTNYSVIDEVDITVNNTVAENAPPTVEIVEPEDGTTVDGVLTVRGNASDDDGDEQIEMVEIKIDSGDWEEVNGTTNWSCEWDTTQVEDGDHTISARAFDGTNHSVIDEVNVTVDNEEPPNQIPTVEITGPQDGQTVEGVVTIEGTASDEDGDDDIQYVEIRIDNGDWLEADGTIGWNYQWDTADVGDGEHTIHAKAYDGIDHSDIVEVDVTVDNEEPGNNRPTVSITGPQDGSTVDGTITIMGTAGDEDGDVQIEKIEIRIDNGDWDKADGTTDWSFQIDTTGFEDGEHTVLARAYDGKDLSIVGSITLEFDNVGTPSENSAPEIISFTTGMARYKVGGTLVLDGEVEDTDGMDDIVGVSIIVYLVDGASHVEVDGYGIEDLTLEEVDDETIAFELSIPLSGYETGYYLVQLEVEDSGGESDTEKVYFKIEDDEPSDDADDPDLFWPMVAIVSIVVLALLGFALHGRAGGAAAEPVEIAAPVEVVETASPVVFCPRCGGLTQYSKEYRNHYCWACGRYITEMEMETGP